MANGKLVKRTELYQRAWSEPMSSLAKEFGISDVGLAKACRKLEVPLPPRGWWARKSAGKPAPVTPLPARPPGLVEETRIGARYSYAYWDAPSTEEILGPIPPLPVFEETIEAVRARVEAMIGKTAIVQRNLDHTPPAVAKLLRRDENRRRKQAELGYHSSYYDPIYASPFQQRRLRLLSSILLTAARCGCTAESSGSAGFDSPQEEFSVTVGSTHVGLWVGAVTSKVKAGPKGMTSTTPAPKIHVEVNRGDFRKVGALTWEDVDASDGKLIRDIAIAIVVKGEEILRASTFAHHEWWLKRREDILAEREKARLEAERKEQERLAALEKKRVENLLDQAESLRNARAIRAFVDEVRATLNASTSDGERERFDRWAIWALAQADRIDPVLNGSFLSGMDIT